MEKSRRGVLAALGGCLASGVAAPLVSFLKVFRTEELLMVRGLFAVAAALVILNFRIVWTGWKLIASAVILGASTWCYYQAMRSWGVDLTMVVLTMSPMVNFILQRFRREKVKMSAIIALVGVVAGAALALQPWHGDMNMRGLVWSVVSMLLTGIGFDLLGQTDGEVFNRVFWFGLVYALGGLALCLFGGSLPFQGTALVGSSAFLLIVFAAASAAVYVSNIFTFDNLRREVASVLNASQIVPIIIGAWIMTGEHLSPGRMAGAALSFASATALSIVVHRAANKNASLTKDPH